MDILTEKFKRLGIDNAPGQESRQAHTELDLAGGPVAGASSEFLSWGCGRP